MSKTPHYDCPSEEIHTPHLHTIMIESIPVVAKCYGWTYSDEFYKLIDAEWANWDDKHWGFDRDSYYG